ncbi:MAG: hypothetical protein E2O54_09435 [Gammaproteobacteria bacterium]|nr:MAG: hypothetical protein E2O54_09435 [Gammaproteobacteria bacterium]
MTRPRLLRAGGLCCLMATFASFSPSATAQDIIEEIVVTGSYIKRDSFDSASPLTVIDQEQIAANATPNLGEILVDQTFNYGTEYQTNTYAARFQLGNTSQANLRGLGPGATLDLIDGRRTNNPFLTNTIPQIAIERIDILKDGASALYGTDAVAGVVNIIPRKDFSGIKATAFYTEDKRGDFDESQLELLMGSDTDNGHITVGLRYSNRGELQQVDRAKYLRQGFERSGTGNPGDWLVPDRDATGAIVGSTRRVDPGCGTENGPGGTDVGQKRNYVSGDVGTTSGQENCRLHFGEWWNFMNPQDQYSAWVNFRFDFSDNISNEMDIIYARLETDSRGSAQNPGGRTEEFPIVLGTHPGNPYRAFGDMNANDMLDPGEQLFALDADNDGIPDRGSVDANGDGVMDVILHPDAFNPAGGGIPFNEDVDVIALRAMGKLGTKASELLGDGSNTGNATFDQTDFRIADTLTIAIADTSWEVQTTGIYEKWDWNFSQKNTSQSRLVQGLQGQLKANSDDGFLSTWNPFSTQQLSCVDRVCSDTGTPGFANTQDVMNSINITADDIEEFQFYSFGVIATGDLYELPAGTLAGAFGYEYRNDQRDTDINAQQNACDWHEGGCGLDWKAEQDVASAFFEFYVPVLSGGAGGELELQLAGRYVDYGGEIGDDFTPKIAALWQPIDMLSVRASWSQAFIAPTLEDQFETEDCGLQTANDPITLDFTQSFRAACPSGNRALVAEEADVFNIGLSLELLDRDLKLGVDYAVYDFDDRIIELSMNNVINQDFDNFLAAGLAAGDQTDIDIWFSSGMSDPNIIRDTTGVITKVKTRRLNAASMKNKSWDFYGRYNLPWDAWGLFTVNLNATFVDEYSYNLGPGLPSGDAAGRQNEELVDIPPIPEWRFVGRLNWTLNNHSAMIKVRWFDEYDLSFNSGALFGGQLFFNGTDKADDITYVDANYAYRFQGLLGEDQETVLEVGGRNIFDEFPDPIFNLGGIETFVHDIRGAMWYVRLTQEL